MASVGSSPPATKRVSGLQQLVLQQLRQVGDDNTGTVRPQLVGVVIAAGTVVMVHSDHQTKMAEVGS